jgi:uncharacterized membrane protein
MHLSLSGADIAAILIAMASLVAAVANAIVTIRTGTKMDAVTSSVNGHAAQLNALTAQASYARGVAGQPPSPQETPPLPWDPRKGP